LTKRFNQPQADETFQALFRIFKQNCITMKKKIVFGILALATISFSACDKHNGCARSEKATVFDFSDTDTCGIVFRLEDGNYLEATNLNEFQAWEAGDLVWISHKETSGASTCGLGDVIQIRCVVAREF
jgi:hypothetical protein